MRLFKVVFLFLGMMIGFADWSHAQDSTTTVTWKATAKKTGPNTFLITLNGTIKESWHVYAFTNEDVTGITLAYNDSTVNFDSLEVNAIRLQIQDPVFEKKIDVATGQVQLIQLVRIDEKLIHAVKGTLSYYVGKETNFIPEEQKINIVFDSTAAIPVNRILIPTIDINNTIADCGTSSTSAGPTKSKGLMSLFILGFLGGLVALLTPCVFPMIPLTVSFFTKKAGSRKAGISNAMLYGFFIFFIYILLSLPFHFLDKLNPEILNNISTNVYLNVFFFAIFIFFAFSFFGYYEITLPAGLSSKADSKAGAGNIAGIFFMALTLALVSFSCTGPILGSLLAGSLTNDGGAMQLTAGMGGFGLALALPFALFALFPNWLNSLPKSGGWLNTVKVVLGFLELGLALKFLSNADLVKHWGLLKREIFIGLWVVIGVGLTAYLFGFIRFKHDDPGNKPGKARLFLAIISGLFTLYLVPGLTNTKWANLKMISGFPPPLYYSIYSDGSQCVLGLNCTHDYEEGLRMSKAENKPILLDFTGYACVNCRRMEEKVWSQPDVYKLMKDNFIVVSLYVDDKKKLPASQQFTYKTKDGVEKEIVTVGDKWATFETENFASNAQPLYALLDTEEKLLTHPVGYTPTAEEYLQWLQCGLNAFKKKP